MRVATIFTGVAAATVGVTQVANAQDAAHPAAKQTSKHIGRAMRPASAIFGSIRSAAHCALSGTDKTWLHVSTITYFSDGYGYTSLCFGFKGIFDSPLFTGIRAECGGITTDSLRALLLMAVHGLPPSDQGRNTARSTNLI
jgi:hypothetical protein